MSKVSISSFLVLAFLAMPTMAQTGSMAAQCTSVTNSAGVNFLACKPDDGAAADIGPAEGVDADGMQVGPMCAAKSGAGPYTLICLANSGEGSGCACQDPNTGQSFSGRVTKVGQ